MNTPYETIKSQLRDSSPGNTASLNHTFMSKFTSSELRTTLKPKDNKLGSTLR